MTPTATDPTNTDSKYDWNPNDIFADWQQWQSAMTAIRTPMQKLDTFKGQLTKSPKNLQEAYETEDEIQILLYRLYRYPSLKFDINQKDLTLRTRLQEVSTLISEIESRYSWMTPELLAGNEKEILSWLDSEKGLEPYDFQIREQFRLKNHYLDARGEELLAYAANFNRSPGDIYGALSTADIQFETVEIDGTEETITYGAYRRLLEKCESQDDRRKVFEAMYKVFVDKKNTYAAIYEAVCQRDWATAKARKFSSCAEAALHGDDVPVSVLETLIDTAREGAHALQRYHKFRAKVLGLEGNYHLYDGLRPLVPSDKDYPFDDVCGMVISSVKPLGEDYTERMRTAISSRWIDVHEKEGKRSGAYSAGVYGVHPYMLLNYNNTLDAVFTLAHELGHTLHTVYADEAQPFAKSDYTIFVAEVASTTNEGLLLRYLREQIQDKSERFALLAHLADSVAGTFYTQVMFADYELRAHQMVERGEPVNAASLDALYASIFKDFYGDAVVWDPDYATTWARIPHFFRSPFYVYQYATCFASSAQLLKGINSDSPDEYVAKYLNLLKSGGSEAPMIQLQKAGVDLRKPDTVRAVVDQMNDLVSEMEAIAE